MSQDDVELPDGWRIISTGEVAEVVGGGTPKTSVAGNFTDEDGHPWITPADLTGYSEKYISRGRRNLTDQGIKSSSAKYMPAGSVLFSSRAPIGYVAIASNPVTTNQGFRSFVPNDEVESEYLYYALKLLRPEAEQLASGTTFPEISGTNAKKLRFPLAPRDMQRRVVNLLDHTVSSTTSASCHLTAARLAIERFRQAVLAAACSGRLTADWREKNPGSAQKLMGDLMVTSLSSKHPIAKPDPTLLTNTPDGWSAVTLDLLIDHIEAGKSFNTLGRPATDDEWGVVKVSAMSWGHFLQDENKAIPPGHSINPTYEIKSGDLLISRANTVELVGATVLVDKTRPRLLLSDKSLRLVPRGGISKHWLNLVLGAPMVREQLSSLATGTSDSMRNLSQPKILATTLALPSTEEQEELARVVDQLFAMADKLLHRVETASKRVDQSSQAVLAKAFRGQLALAAAV